jgi:exopolysaccharide production protein ExoQ
MPAPIAFLGCLAFVLFMLRIEHKESKGVTAYLWVPTLWFLLTFTRPLALWFETGGETIEQGSPLDRIFLLFLFAVANITLFRRRSTFSMNLGAMKWVLLLLGYTLVSTVWSEIAFISFRRWFTMAIAVLIILSVHSEPFPRIAVESILRRMAYICVPFSYVLIHYFPDYGKIYVHNEGVEMWTGVALHKNSLSQLCMMAILYLVWRIVTRWKDYRSGELSKYGLYGDIWVVFVAILVSMGPVHSITYSATATVSTACGLSVLFFLRWRKSKTIIPAALYLGLTAFLIIYGTITPFLGKLSLVDVSSAVGRNDTLTGRTEVWRALMPEVAKSPVVGHGYGGFWTTEAREKFDISDAHNGYLGVILETGFLGLLIFSAMMLSAARIAYTALYNDYDWGCFCMMLPASTLLHNIAEQSLNGLTQRLMALMLLVIFVGATHGRAAETEVVETSSEPSPAY